MQIIQTRETSLWTILKFIHRGEGGSFSQKERGTTAITTYFSQLKNLEKKRKRKQKKTKIFYFSFEKTSTDFSILVKYSNIYEKIPE